MFFAMVGVTPETYPRRLALAVFKSTPTRFTTLSTTPASARPSSAWLKIVLIPPHADRLRRNLHQLRQRVLQTAAQAHSAARCDVEVGNTPHSPASKPSTPTCPPRSRWCSEARASFRDQVRHHLLGLATARPVPDDHRVGPMFASKSRERALCARHIRSRRRGVTAV